MVVCYLLLPDICLTSAPPPKKNILYTIKLATAEDLAKAPAKRTTNQTRVAELGEDEAFDRIRAKILTFVDEIFDPLTLAISDYELMFQVPARITAPVPLVSEDDFKMLTSSALRKKDPCAIIYVCARVVSACQS